MKRAALLAALLLTACAPALRAPKPVAQIGGGAPELAARSVDDLLAAGQQSWMLRPDAGAVRASLAASLAAARGDDRRIEGLVSACRAAAWLVEHESEASRRLELVSTELDAAQGCSARAAADPRCDYALAIALGQQARERPATAADGLPKMVAALRRAIAAAPELDKAGPHRVLALLLLRAPGWPLGPGDEEAGLAAAQSAAALRPTHPPNLVALGEGLAKSGRAEEARQTLERARALAGERMLQGDPDAAEWLRAAESALAALPPLPAAARPTVVRLVPESANFRRRSS